MKSPVQQPPPDSPTLSVHHSELKSEPSLQHEPPVSALPIDDVPDGGYGWVVVSACSLITYGLFPRFDTY